MSDERREGLRRAGRVSAEQRRTMSGDEAAAMGLAFRMLKQGEPKVAMALMAPVVERLRLDQAADRV